MKNQTTLNLFQHDPVRRRAWVLYQLKIQGISIAKLAGAHGVSAQAIRNALIRPYPRMEKVLADALSLMPQELFPERYDANGFPNRKRGRPANACFQVNQVTSLSETHTGSASQAAEHESSCHGEAA